MSYLFNSDNDSQTGLYDTSFVTQSQTLSQTSQTTTAKPVSERSRRNRNGKAANSNVQNIKSRNVQNTKSRKRKRTRKNRRRNKRKDRYDHHHNGKNGMGSNDNMAKNNGNDDDDDDDKNNTNDDSKYGNMAGNDYDDGNIANNDGDNDDDDDDDNDCDNDEDAIKLKRTIEGRYDIKESAKCAYSDLSESIKEGVDDIKTALTKALKGDRAELADDNLSSAIFESKSYTIDKLMRTVYILYRCVDAVKAGEKSFKTNFHLVERSHFALRLILEPHNSTEKFKTMIQRRLMLRLSDHEASDTYEMINEAIKNENGSDGRIQTIRYETAQDYLRIFRALFVWYVDNVKMPSSHCPPDYHYEWGKEQIIFDWTTCNSSEKHRKYTLVMLKFFRHFIPNVPVHQLKQKNTREYMNNFMLGFRKKIQEKRRIFGNHEMKMEIAEDAEPERVTKYLEMWVSKELWRGLYHFDDRKKKHVWSIMNDVSLNGDIAVAIEKQGSKFFSDFLGTFVNGDFLLVDGRLSFLYHDGDDNVLHHAWFHKQSFLGHFDLHVVPPTADDKPGKFTFIRRRGKKKRPKITISNVKATTENCIRRLFHLWWKNEFGISELNEKELNALNLYANIVGLANLFSQLPKAQSTMDKCFNKIGQITSTEMNKKKISVDVSDRLMLYVEDLVKGVPALMKIHLEDKFETEFHTINMKLGVDRGLDNVVNCLVREHPYAICRNVVVASGDEKELESFFSSNQISGLEHIAKEILGCSDGRMYVPLTRAVLNAIVVVAFRLEGYSVELLRDVKINHIVGACPTVLALTVNEIKHCLGKFYITGNETGDESEASLNAYNEFYANGSETDPLERFNTNDQFFWICLHHLTDGKNRQNMEEGVEFVTIDVPDELKGNKKMQDFNNNENDVSIVGNDERVPSCGGSGQPKGTNNENRSDEKTNDENIIFSFLRNERCFDLVDASQLGQAFNADGRQKGLTKTVQFQIEGQLYSLSVSDLFPVYMKKELIVDVNNSMAFGYVMNHRYEDRTYEVAADSEGEKFSYVIKKDNARKVIANGGKFKLRGNEYTVKKYFVGKDLGGSLALKYLCEDPTDPGGGDIEVFCNERGIVAENWKGESGVDAFHRYFDPTFG